MADSKVVLGPVRTFAKSLGILVICFECGAEVRYVEGPRDGWRDVDTGCLTDEFWEMAEAEHDEECTNPIDCGLGVSELFEVVR